MTGTDVSSSSRGITDDGAPDDVPQGTADAVPEGVPALHWRMGLRYLELGWKLFVMPGGGSAGKVPTALCDACARTDAYHDREACPCLLCHGFYAATDDVERLAAMWRLLPGGVWALRTGAASGVSVIDAESVPDEDGHASGVEVLDAWEEWVPGVELNPTLRARTRSGGVHLFYATGADIHVRVANRVLPAVDVKGNGGYVVLPPGVGGERLWLPWRGDGQASDSAGSAGSAGGDGAVGYARAPSAGLLAWMRSVRGSSRAPGRGYALGAGSGAGGSGDGWGNGTGRTVEEFRELVDAGVPRGMQDEILNEMVFRMVRHEGLRDAGEITRRAWAVVADWVQDDSHPWTLGHVERKALHVLRTVATGATVPSVLPQMARPGERTVFRWDGDAGVLEEHLKGPGVELLGEVPADAVHVQTDDTRPVPPVLGDVVLGDVVPGADDTESDDGAVTAVSGTSEAEGAVGADVAEVSTGAVIAVDFETRRRGADAEAERNDGITEEGEEKDGYQGPPDDGSGRVGYTGETADGHPATEGMHDAGNANRLVRLHGHEMRWLADEGRWLVWDGHAWKRDHHLRVDAWTMGVMADIHEHSRTVSGEEAKAWATHMRASYATGRRTAMQQAARSVPGMPVTSVQLDSDPRQLVVHNGVLDLFTGKLSAGRKEDLNTLCANVAYRPTATCNAWRRHVDTITCGDKALARYLQRLAGYSLTGLTNEQAFFSLEGSGANGKNAFIEPLVMMMGDYADIADSRLVASGDKTHAAILADLVGKRMVFLDEIASGRALDTERVKALCGGAAMKAQFMAKDWFTFTPQVKLWIAGNTQPPIRDGSDGLWRRMHRVKFQAKIAEGERVKGYSKILFEAEGPGILNWCLEGLRDWVMSGGLGMPDGVAADVAELREDSDHVRGFVGECFEVTGRIRQVAADHRTVLAEGDWITNADIQRVYRAWCERNGITDARQRLNSTQMRRHLESLGTGMRGFNDTRSGKQERGVQGVRLRVTEAEMYLR